MESGMLVQVLFGLLSVLTAGLFLVGGVLAFRASRSAGSILLMVGAVLSVICTVFWLAFHVRQMSGEMSFDSAFFRIGLSVMQFVSTLAWLLMGVGVLMLSLLLGKVGRENDAP